MNSWRYLVRSLTYHSWMLLTVAAGVAVSTAVLTGALVVGDSVQHSLRQVTWDRLGQLHSVLIADHFFTRGLAERLAADNTFRSRFAAAHGALWLQQVTLESTVAINTPRKSAEAPPASAEKAAPTDAASTDGAPTDSEPGVGGRRSRGVQLLGIGPEFWELYPAGHRPQKTTRGRQVILNAPLAADLQVQVGDRVLVRLPAVSSVAGDSVLADKSDLTRTLAELEVIEILPAVGPGRFSAQPSQQFPWNAYVELATLQDALERPEHINAIFVATAEGSEGVQRAEQVPSPPDDLLAVTLADLDLQLTEVQQTYRPASADGNQSPSEPTVAYRYAQLSTQRMVLPAAAEVLMPSVMEYLGGTPVITYLANRLERLATAPVPTAAPPTAAPPTAAPPAGTAAAAPPGGAQRTMVPYSTISGVALRGDLSPLAGMLPRPPGNSASNDTPPAEAQPSAPSELGELADNEVVLNSWLAAELGAQVGDTIRVHYFLPETTDANPQEVHTDLQVRGVVPITSPARPYSRSGAAEYIERPTLANDPALTPTVAGITDQESIDDWDPPFPYDNRLIKSADEDYWDNYRTTPKAFVGLGMARKLWNSRFGVITSYRIPLATRSLEEVQQELERVLRGQQAEFGFRWLTLRADGVRAAAGTTPFNGLFLSFSFFLIAAALLLVLLLFRLLMEQRARETGLLLAVGTGRRRLSQFWLTEGAVVAGWGSLGGVPLGIGYAALMLLGLRTIWLGAVTTPFLELSVRPTSLLMGGVVGAAVALLTIAWSCRQAGLQPARELLAGRGQGILQAARRPGRYHVWIIAGLVAAALGLGIMALGLSGDAQAGAFFGGGVSMLVAMLLTLQQSLRGWSRVRARPGIRSLVGLAGQNLARNLTRSLLTIALLASASFLIVAVSAFRLPPTDRGTGRFDFVAESDRPIFENLDTAEGLDAWFGGQAEELAGLQVVSMRVRAGDDASCRNLFKAQRPRLLGVPAAAREMLSQPDAPRFAWFAQLQPDGTSLSPWLQLASGTASGTANGTASSAQGSPAGVAAEAIPVVLDKNTAMYSLGLLGGAGQEFSLDYGEGRLLKFRVVGLLDNSVLQGMLLVSDEVLLRYFPEVAGYQYFLVDVPDERRAQSAALLERMLSDRGFDLRSSREILADLYAIQNTYLSTFQSLGGLGLLLGTLGLAVVQVRNVLERRGELGLLQALGFRRGRLVRLVLWEHFLLLGWGILLGTVAAAWVVLPHWWAGGAAVPWLWLAGILGLVFVLGLVSGGWAVQRGLRANLLQALRQE